MGLFNVLTLIFVVLKLVGVIAWSWWLVLLPTIIAIGIWLVVFITMLVAFVYAMFKLKRENGREFGDD